MIFSKEGEDPQISENIQLKQTENAETQLNSPIKDEPEIND